MNNKILSKVFGWMFIGLLITFLTGYVVTLNQNMVINIFSKGVYIFLIIIELLLVLFFSFRIFKMNEITAKTCFLLYSFISGLTFSSIFIAYQLSSIMYVFLISSLLFAILAIIGSKTNIDLSSIRIFLFIGLIGVFLSFIVNIFVRSSSFDLIISIIALIVFLGYTVYDVQKIIRMSEFDQIPENNLAIYGAFQLYLDYINIFIRLLELYGKRRD